MGCVFTDAEVVNEWNGIAFPSHPPRRSFSLFFMRLPAWNLCSSASLLMLCLIKLAHRRSSKNALNDCNYWDTHKLETFSAPWQLLFTLYAMLKLVEETSALVVESRFRVWQRRGVCHTLIQKERDKFSIARDHSAACCCWRWCFNAGN